MKLAIAFLAAVLPPLLVLWFFHSRDRFREPLRVVWTTFVLGVLTPLPIVVFALPVLLAADFVGQKVVKAGILAFLSAAAPEEFFKYLVLRLYAARHHAFDEPMDGIVYGAVASLGFATAENVLYVLQGGVFVGLFRAFTAIPMHASLGAIMGYYVGRARAEPAKASSNLFMALGVPILLHGLYDLPLLTLMILATAEGGLEPTPGNAITVVGLVALALGVLTAVVTWALIVQARARKAQHAIVLAQGATEGP